MPIYTAHVLLNSIPSNFNPAWLMLVIAVTALVSAVLVALINNLLANKKEKDARLHEVNVKKLELHQEAKSQAINDFTASAGKYIANSSGYARVELLANYGKVLPYLCEASTLIAKKLVVEEKCEKPETLIELAESIRDNDIRL